MRLSALALLFAASPLTAQWQIQNSHTTASLRGIHALPNGVAWASGTNGTILRTTDNGTNWQTCTTPPDAEKLDFRGIQAFDDKTAIVMSSGKGDLSRLYKTTDACQTWRLLFTNPDKEGFWDAYVIGRGHTGILIGDPVDEHIAVWRPNLDFATPTLGPFHHRPRALKGESEFAASNSSVFVADPFFDFWIATGGKSGARVIKRINHDFDSFGFDSYRSIPVPVGSSTESSGIFSLYFRKTAEAEDLEKEFLVGISVGGDFTKPDDSTHTAAFTLDGGQHWKAAQTPPHGYRSAVAYSPTTKTWATVGPNGTDISTDDGRNWKPLTPTKDEPADADKNWNALSLPFVVGPNGRIGKLNPTALGPGAK